jgi:hypothetical protein
MQIDEKEYLALCQNVLMLQARVDALNAFCQTVATGHGATSKKFVEAIQTMTQTCYQKRLERIEGQSPALAALIATGIDLPKIDQSLLDGLKFDDQPDDENQ